MCPVHNLPAYTIQIQHTIADWKNILRLTNLIEESTVSASDDQGDNPVKADMVYCVNC